ncbi:MAG: hypothetical protein ABSF09_00435 [Candidatus Bathyarchaeia archaeon]
MVSRKSMGIAEAALTIMLISARTQHSFSILPFLRFDPAEQPSALIVLTTAGTGTLRLKEQ